jgi:NADPH:quinone reductase-like Zn-dependent oxidoreductase
MKAARVHRFGPPEVVVIDEIDIPPPDEHQVLVQVNAAGVGPWDGWIRSGKSVLPQPLPMTLGSDLSGIVAAVGSGVTAFARGDEVFGVSNARFTDGNAEYAVALASMIARKPRRLGHVDAAAIPVVAVTALQMLADHARVQPGQRVLILGAAGAVGGFAVQLARSAGAYVIATVRGKDVEYARRLGAHEVIDVASAGPDRAGPVDAVIDLVGGEAQERSWSQLAPGGVLVSAVSRPEPDRERVSQRVKATFMLVQVATAPLARIAALLDSGQLMTTRVSTILPLADARVAHEMLEGMRPRARGKIVLQVR